MLDLGVAGPILFRVPYGERLLALPYVLWQQQRSNILWSQNTYDWSAEVDEDQVVERVISGAANGGIVLLHDSSEKTVRATQRIIPTLRENGYSFLTVSQMLVLQD